MVKTANIVNPQKNSSRTAHRGIRSPVWRYLTIKIIAIIITIIIIILIITIMIIITI